MTHEQTPIAAGDTVITRCNLHGVSASAAPVHVRRGVRGRITAVGAAGVEVDVRAGDRLVMTFTALPEQLLPIAAG